MAYYGSSRVIRGQMGPGLEYRVQYHYLHMSSIRPTAMDNYEQEPKKKKRDANFDPEKRQYSNGITFLRKARVRRVPYDQLETLPLSQKRVPRDDGREREKKSYILRKLCQLGGWIFVGRRKRRLYVPAGTELPDDDGMDDDEDQEAALAARLTAAGAGDVRARCRRNRQRVATATY
uniref:Uncharacterized protein n=1 Tax=Romanomermis culicivorax TaxID=13658 RepID=A0A915KIS8_ROMCU